MEDPDEWLEGVRRWFYGGTEPGEAGAAGEGPAAGGTVPTWPASPSSGPMTGAAPAAPMPR